MTLLLAEELLLLAYGPDGTARGKSVELDCALGGALLVELVLDGHVELSGKLIRAKHGTPPPHPRLAEAYTRIAGRPRSPQAWVGRLAKGTRRRLLHDLVEAGVLSDVSYRWLGMFPRHRFPLNDPAAREGPLRRLREAVLDGQPPCPRTAGLATVIGAAGLDRRIFPGEDHRAVSRRLREISEVPWAGEAVRRAIEAVHAATVAAAVAASASAGSADSG
jgi:hypothetical protein